MLIFRGRASVVGIFGAAFVGLAPESLIGSIALSYCIAGTALGAFGWYVNAELAKEHALFWIPIQYWAF